MRGGERWKAKSCSLGPFYGLCGTRSYIGGLGKIQRAGVQGHKVEGYRMKGEEGALRQCLRSLGESWIGWGADDCGQGRYGRSANEA